MTDAAVQKREVRRSVALLSAVGFAACGWLVGRAETSDRSVPLVAAVAKPATMERVHMAAPPVPPPRMEAPSSGLREAPRVVRRIVVVRRSRAS